MRPTRFALAGSATAIAATLGSGLVLPEPAFGQTVADRTLSDVHAESTGGCTVLTVNFNIRVQMLSSFPVAGRELHVRLRPLDNSAGRRLRESLRTPTTVAELTSIEYEGDNPAGPTLSLFLTRDMQFAVSPGAQPQSLIIQLSEPGASCSGHVKPADQAQAAEGLYAINLLSSAGELGDLSPAQQSALGGAATYESQSEKDSQVWHRLRAGFYPSAEAAEAARAKLAELFPGAWVVKVTPEERQQGLANRLGGSGSPPPAAMPGTPADQAQTTQLISQGEQAIRDGDIDRAIQLLTNAAQQPENADTPRAIELLGAMRERKGQAAHARAQYTDYLRRFPNAEGAERVRQRLAALDSASAGTPQLHAASAGTAGWKWGVRGSLSQFYFRDQARTNSLITSSTLGTEVDNSVNLNQLQTTGDITISGGNDRRQFQLRAAGSYTKDFGTSNSFVVIDNGTEKRIFRNRGALSALYLDYNENDLNMQMRVGRQTRNSAGVLGRFDGALVSWQANPKLRFNVVGGFPVLSSRQLSVLSERPFYGLSVDLGAKRSPLQTTFYWFDQHAKGGFVDRRSVGVETRFVKKSFNAYAMLDYDVKFNTMNLGIVSLNYGFKDGANLSLIADYRKSPLLTTTNALIGQFDTATTLPFDSLAGLRPFFTDPQIYQLARDRTLTAKSITATYSRPITKKLQLSADVSLTDTGGTPGTPATAGTPEVTALPAIGKEYYYGLQLIGSDLLMGNDIYIISGRYANASTARIYTIDFNARLPVTNTFRVSPRLRYGYRDGKAVSLIPGGTFKQFQPTLRLNYFPIKHSEIEVEFGGNFTRQTLWNTTSSAFDRISESGWVLSAGYRLDF